MILAALTLAAAQPHLAAPLPEPCEAITTVNVIDVMPGRTREARQYYRSGWEAARKVALERGAIAGYSLLVSQSGESAEPEIVLITTYANSDQFERAEDEFQAIFAELDLPRPFLIEGLTRAEIVGPVKGSDDYRTIISSSGNCAIPGHSPTG